jgi:hypothetical protein
MDTAVRVQLQSPSQITSIDWSWTGEGTWELRATTLISTDGAQEQLMLLPGLKRTMFPVMKVYEPETSAVEGATLLRDAITASDDEALTALHAMDPDQIQQTVIFAADQEVPPRLATSDTGPSRFVRQAGPPERLVYQRAGGVGDGYLVVDDAWFPGWRAEVDGAPTPIYRVNVGYKAVYVPADAQTVVLTYAPRSVVVGALVTMGALVAAILLVFHTRILASIAGLRRRA